MIGGVLKELTTILLGVTVLHDKLNMINSLGIAVVFSGVLLYKASLHFNDAEKDNSTDENVIYDSVDLHRTDSSISIQEEDSSSQDECDYSNDNDCDLQLALDKSVRSRRVNNVCKQVQNHEISDSTERDAMIKEII